jgi:hypothetical protein
MLLRSTTVHGNGAAAVAVPLTTRDAGPTSPQESEAGRSIVQMCVTESTLCIILGILAEQPRPSRQSGQSGTGSDGLDLVVPRS